MREYARDPLNEMNDQFLDNALAKGDRCFAILDGDILASYGWYSNNATSISDELVFRFSADWIYMYKGFTRSDYRGLRLHALGMALALREYSKYGFRGIVSNVEANNYNSLKSVHRMGYHDIDKILALKLFGKYWIRTGQRCKSYGIELLVSNGIRQPRHV